VPDVDGAGQQPTGLVERRSGDPDDGGGAEVWQDLATMLDLLAGTIVELLGFGVAAINVARPDGALEVVAVAGDPGARETLLGTVNSGQSFDDILADSEEWGRLRFVDHAAQDVPTYVDWVPDLPPSDLADAWHPEDALFAPLLATDGRRVGVLSVDLPQDGRRPDAATRRGLEAFAVSTALAIEHAIHRQHAEESRHHFRERALRDWLTGLGNRALLLERLDTLAAAPATTLTALVFIDLDGFKEVNDRHGHLAGDRVLQSVADRIRSVSRPADTVVRWGGDEFLVLLEDVAGHEVVDIAQRVCDAVSEPVLYRGQELQVSASVGISYHSPEDVSSVDDLVRRADAAMYRAKAAGRDRWVVSGPAVAPAGS
jgi:diguanylate cyclase (GGDEF)-like protein